MRSFVDGHGLVWEVVLGRESWGRIVAILYCREGGGPVLEALLEGAGYEQASRELDDMDTEGLRHMLENAHPKDLA